eukprot:25114_1
MSFSQIPPIGPIPGINGIPNMQTQMSQNSNVHMHTPYAANHGQASNTFASQSMSIQHNQAPTQRFAAPASGVDRYSYNQGWNDCYTTYQTLILAGQKYIQYQAQTLNTNSGNSNSGYSKPQIPQTQIANTPEETVTKKCIPVPDATIERVMYATLMHYSTNRTQLKNRAQCSATKAWEVFGMMAEAGLLCKKEGASRYNIEQSIWYDSHVKKDKGIEPIKLKSVKLTNDKMNNIYKKCIQRINADRLELLRKIYPNQINKMYPVTQKRTLDDIESEDVQQQTEQTDSKELSEEPPLKKRKKQDLQDTNSSS